MNDELSYAEMLEIPVETVTVNKKEKKRRTHGRDLSEQVVSEVNERLEDPSYAESKLIEREAKTGKKRSRAGRILVGEFAAVCALCAAIFLTNLFMENSAINTFVRGLFKGNSSSAADTRSYTDFTLSPVVNDYANIEITVAETGALSFTAECSVYSPCEGKLESVSGTKETGYSLRVRHSDSFTTVISGLDEVFAATGDAVRTNIPLGWTDGDGEVRVMFYDGNTLISGVTAEGGAVSWS